MALAPPTSFRWAPGAVVLTIAGRGARFRGPGPSVRSPRGRPLASHRRPSTPWRWSAVARAAMLSSWRRQTSVRPRRRPSTRPTPTAWTISGARPALTDVSPPRSRPLARSPGPLTVVHPRVRSSRGRPLPCQDLHPAGLPGQPRRAAAQRLTRRPAELGARRVLL